MASFGRDCTILTIQSDLAVCQSKQQHLAKLPVPWVKRCGQSFQYPQKNKKRIFRRITSALSLMLFILSAILMLIGGRCARPQISCSVWLELQTMLSILDVSHEVHARASHLLADISVPWRYSFSRQVLRVYDNDSTRSMKVSLSILGWNPDSDPRRSSFICEVALGSNNSVNKDHPSAVIELFPVRSRAKLWSYRHTFSSHASTVWSVKCESKIKYKPAMAVDHCAKVDALHDHSTSGACYLVLGNQ